MKLFCFQSVIMHTYNNMYEPADILQSLLNVHLNVQDEDLVWEKYYWQRLPIFYLNQLHQLW